VRRSRELLVLSGILLIATLLRLHRLGDELWLDEIITHVRVARLGWCEILTSYESQNQHLLYSLLARLVIVTLGDTAAALRVPAAAFGVLSIAALYVLGRELLSRREALLAAALLSVSHMHVWFSQNARGYSALLFFTLLSSWLLLRALADDRRRAWLGYGVVVALGLGVHLTMLFVVAGHAIVVLRRRVPALPGTTWRTRLSGPVLGLATAALLALLVYAPIVPQILAVTAVEGRGGQVPAWSSSGWAIGEIVRTLRDSFAQPPLALYAVALGAVGAWSLVRRQPVLLELLVLPVALGLVVVLGSGHHVWPRLFFFAIGFAALVVVAGAVALGEGARRLVTHEQTRATHAGTVLAAILIVAAAIALPAAYGPKQRHAEALALLDEAIRPGDVVVTVGPSTYVFQTYYGRDWSRVDTAATLAAARRGARRTWLVHGFPLHLRQRRPDVARMLDDDFELAARFTGTLRGGDVLVWASAAPAGDSSATFPQPPD